MFGSPAALPKPAPRKKTLRIRDGDLAISACYPSVLWAASLVAQIHCHDVASTLGPWTTAGRRRHRHGSVRRVCGSHRNPVRFFSTRVRSGCSGFLPRRLGTRIRVSSLIGVLSRDGAGWALGGNRRRRRGRSSGTSCRGDPLVIRQVSFSDRPKDKS